LQEARVGIGIDNPHVARTYQMLDLRNQQAGGWPPLGLVMPLYEPTLERVLANVEGGRGRLPGKLAAMFAQHLFEGLEALHGQGLVHRDLKPANVLFRLPEGRRYDGPAALEGATALVGDLGTLCRAGEKPVLALRQDGWKAPELFAPGGEQPAVGRAADPAEDWYAFGLLVRALAGAADEAGWLLPLADELAGVDVDARWRAKEALRQRLGGWVVSVPRRKQETPATMEPQREQMLLRAVERLRGKGQRELATVVALHFLDGLAPASIARALGVSSAKVEEMLGRARRLLGTWFPGLGCRDGAGRLP
jgi:hypothetical protein